MCHGRNEKVSCCLMSLHCQRRGLDLHGSSPLSGYTEAGTWLLVVERATNSGLPTAPVVFICRWSLFRFAVYTVCLVKAPGKERIPCGKCVFTQVMSC